MGFWSWLFPTDDDRLARARKLMAAGRYEDARRSLLQCKAPEAEALYEECSAALEPKEREAFKKQLAGQGFHGFRVEVTMTNPKRKAEFEALIAEEIARDEIDLGLPDVDPAAVNAAVARAQRRFRAKAGARDQGMVKLVPIAAAEGARGAGTKKGEGGDER